MTAKIIQVIETRLTTRGSGKDESSPIRGIVQYWSQDGVLLAEVDPCPPFSMPHDPRISEWLAPGAVVPCTPETVAVLVREMARLYGGRRG